MVVSSPTYPYAGSTPSSMGISARKGLQWVATRHTRSVAKNNGGFCEGDVMVFVLRVLLIG